MLGSTTSARREGVEPGWRVWARSLFAIGVVALLGTLGIANIVTHAKWHELEDGVFWAERSEGVTAVEVASGSAGARAGIERGDLLLAVDGAPIQTQADVIGYQHAARPGTRLTYTLARLGTQQVIEVPLTAAPQGTSMYYVLAAVGLFTLLVGASVRLRRPHDQATLHFFWLTVAFFGVLAFTASGRYDRFD